MAFLSLSELVKRRDAVLRDLRRHQKPSLLVQEGILPPEDDALMKQLYEELLRDIEAEIAERTAGFPPQT